MIIRVKVQRGSEKIEDLGQFLKVSTQAEFHNNKANYDIVKQIAKHYGVTVRDVRILKGGRSREKTIEVIK